MAGFLCSVHTLLPNNCFVKEKESTPVWTGLLKLHPCRKWSWWAYSGLTCRTGWAIPAPWKPDPEWPPAWVSGPAQWHNTCWGGRPYCLPPGERERGGAERAWVWEINCKIGERGVWQMSEITVTNRYTGHKLIITINMSGAKRRNLLLQLKASFHLQQVDV